ncbi:MAG: M23 family metallopeptidase [Bacteroidetes bacterium]|nr:M23 family metallopeptidase [Bacteroidota bacterium]
MAKIKYYYDQDSCTYKEISLTKKSLFLKLIKSASFILCLTTIITYARENYFDSKKVVLLKKENNNLKTRYELVMQDMSNIENRLNELQKQDDQVYRVILGSDPIPNQIRTPSIGGIEHYKDLIDKDKNKLILKVSQKADKLRHKLNIQSKSYDKLLTLANKKTNQLACFPSIQPVENKDLRRISSSFGMRPHPTLKILKMHNGQDFAVLSGTPIYATADGIVKKAYYSRTGGNTIEIRHGRFMTRYCHLRSMKVKPGQRVRRGQNIGKSGATGTHCSGPHLHYEILEKKSNGGYKYVNPIHYFLGDLTTAQYAKVKKLVKRNLMSMD